MASAKSTRLRKSGTRNMLANFSIMKSLLWFLRACISCRSSAEHFSLAAGFGYFLHRRFGKFVRLHREGRLELAIAQHLDEIVFARQAMLYQHLRRNVALTQLRQPIQIYDLIFGAENVGESALGQPAMQWHLPAFEAAHQTRSGTRSLAFVAAGGRLAHAAAHTTTDALAVRRSAFRGSQC